MKSRYRNQPFCSRSSARGSIPTALEGGAGEEPTADLIERAYTGPDEEGNSQSWRRIDGDWLGASREFAIKLDNATNNTSLVLAFEIDGGRTLIFAADAQVGSWLSWADLDWTVDGRNVTARISSLARHF